MSSHNYFGQRVTPATREVGEPTWTRDRPLNRREVSGCRHLDSGSVGAMSDPDYTALDRLMPHPVYALQHWVSVLNPSVGTFESVVKPLLEEAHARVARAPRKQAQRSSP